MGSVAKVVTAPVKFVGEAVSNVVDFAMDAVLGPVVSMTSNVVKGMTDDPLGTIIRLGAIASGNPFAMAAAAAANAARNGGSPLDIAFAAGTSYLGGKVGGVGDAAQQASSLRTAANIASIAARQIVNASAAGDDTAEAGQTAAVAAVANFAGGDGDDVLIGGSGNDTLSGEAEYSQSTAFVDNFNSAKETVNKQLASVKGYDKLPKAAQEVVSGSTAAAIASLFSEGLTPNEDQIAKLMAPAITAVETTASAISGKDLSDSSAAQIARVIGDISRTVYEGTNPLEARKVDISEEFKEKINTAIDVVIKDNDLDKTFTSISDNVSSLETAAQKANETALPVDAAADKVNKVIANATAMRNGEVEGFYSLDQWQEDNAIYEEGGRTDQELRDKLVAWNDKYKEITAELDPLRVEYDKALEIHTESLNEVDAAQDRLSANESNLDDAAKPLYKETSKAFTLALRPDFNEEEYRERYSIDPESDAYTHWLVTGRSNLVNKQEYDQEISPFAGEDAVNFADNPSDVTDADIASGKARLERTSDGTYRFTNAPVTVSKFDPRYNRVVTTEYNSAENKYTVTGDNNETLETITENPDGSFTSTSTVSESFPISVAAMQDRMANLNPTLEDLSRKNPAIAVDAASKLFKPAPFGKNDTLDPNSTILQDVELLKVTKAAGTPTEGFTSLESEQMLQLTNAKAYNSLLNQILKKYKSVDAFSEQYVAARKDESIQVASTTPPGFDAGIGGPDTPLPQGTPPGFDAGIGGPDTPLPQGTPPGFDIGIGGPDTPLPQGTPPGVDVGVGGPDTPLPQGTPLGVDIGSAGIPIPQDTAPVVKKLLAYTRSIPNDAPPVTNAEIENAGGLEPYINKSYTDLNKVEEVFKDFGFEPEPEQLIRFEGRRSEAETRKRIGDFVDPRQVTEEEAKEYADTISKVYSEYKPYLESPYGDPFPFDSDAILKQLRGQGGEDFQTKQAATVERLVEQIEKQGTAGKPSVEDTSEPKLSELFGKTGQEVTSKDIDFITDIIAQQKALSEREDARNPYSPNYALPPIPQGTTPTGIDIGIGGPDTPLPQGTTPTGIDIGIGGPDTPLPQGTTPSKPNYYEIPDILDTDGLGGTVVIGGGDTPEDYTPDGYYKVGRSIYDVLTDPFDLNKDNKIDDEDKTILEQVKSGRLPRTGLPEGNPFRSEGIKGQLEETQRQIARQSAEQRNLALLQQLGETSTVNVKGPDPAQIDYAYDPFSAPSIFATPEQERAFIDPFIQRSNIPPQGIAGVLGGRR